MSKLQQKTKDDMKTAFLQYPTKTNNQLSKMLKISHVTIGKYRKEYSLQIDSEFIAITAGKFIQEFGHAIDHWKLQIDELEVLKKSESSLSAMEILAINKEQASLRGRILFLGGQGEVREVIKVMRSGQLPPMVVSS